jgi:hypothetical protein
VLASRAGGHYVGAPATRAEERAMAVEIVKLRPWLEHALKERDATRAAPSSGAASPILDTLYLETIELCAKQAEATADHRKGDSLTDCFFRDGANIAATRIRALADQFTRPDQEKKT